MYRATADIVLPIMLIGWLSRVRWYTESIGAHSLMQAMVDASFREQNTDTVLVHVKDQESAGVDILTDAGFPVQCDERRYQFLVRSGKTRRMKLDSNASNSFNQGIQAPPNKRRRHLCSKPATQSRHSTRLRRA